MNYSHCWERAPDSRPLLQARFVGPVKWFRWAGEWSAKETTPARVLAAAYEAGVIDLPETERENCGFQTGQHRSKT